MDMNTDDFATHKFIELQFKFNELYAALFNISETIGLNLDEFGIKCTETQSNHGCGSLFCEHKLRVPRTQCQ